MESPWWQWRWKFFLSAHVDVQCDMNIGHVPLYLYLIVTYSMCWGDFLKNSWDKAQSRRPIPQCQRFIIQTDMHVRVHTITQRTTSNFIMQTDKAKLWSCRQWKLRMNLRPKRILRITQNPSKTQSCHPTNLYRSVCEFVCVTTASLPMWSVQHRHYCHWLSSLWYGGADR